MLRMLGADRAAEARAGRRWQATPEPYSPEMHPDQRVTEGIPTLGRFKVERATAGRASAYKL